MDWLKPLDKITSYYLCGGDMNKYPEMGFEGGMLDPTNGVKDVENWLRCFDVEGEDVETVLAVSWGVPTEKKGIKTLYQYQYLFEVESKGEKSEWLAGLQEDEETWYEVEQEEEKGAEGQEEEDREEKEQEEQDEYEDDREISHAKGICNRLAPMLIISGWKAPYQSQQPSG